MTTTLTAVFDGRALVPTDPLNLPKGTVVRVSMEVADSAQTGTGSLAEHEACGMWADRTDLPQTPIAARDLRRQVERGRGKQR